MEKVFTCRVCKNSISNVPYIGKEMMFGLRDEFVYFKCSQCGCLQIETIPQNMDKYYPSDYYSFNLKEEHKSFKSRFADYLLNKSINVRLGKSDFLGSCALLYNNYYKNAYSYLNKGLCTFQSNILDIGCGNGFLLNRLSTWGFTELTGVDPYISEDVYYSNGVRVLKKEIKELSDSYDLIMMHHSFEHMPNPCEVFKDVSRILSKNGLLIIRIPLVDSYAWRKYGMDWYQVDAPRHFFLHTIKSVSFLAELVDLKIDKIEFDSTVSQMLNSEQYLQNVSLMNQKLSEKKSIMKVYRKKAKELNSLKDGDQACFYLKRV